MRVVGEKGIRIYLGGLFFLRKSCWSPKVSEGPPQVRQLGATLTSFRLVCLRFDLPRGMVCA
jgi:hypothetical protein